MLIKSFGKSSFFNLQCKKNRVLVSMHLSEGRGKSLIGAVGRDKSRGKLNVFWRERCREKGERKGVKRGLRDRSVIFMQLVRGGGGSGWVFAG